MRDIRFIFVPLGSAGDVNPLVWLAGLAAERGYDVRMVVQEFMIEHARRAGFKAIATGSKEQQELVARDPDIWHPARGFRVLARHFAGWAKEAIPAIRAEIASGRTVLVGAGIAFGARIVAELDRVPLVTVQLQPSVFMSPYETPVVMTGFERVKRAPLWLRKLLFRISQFEVDRLLKKPVNELRADVGLRQPVRGILNRWGFSPDLVLALFPSWFGPPQPDWPAHAVTTRFPLRDEAKERPLTAELDAFLRDGSPPILLTPGSANLHAHDFFAQGLAACQNVGRRALLVTPFKEHLPARLPAEAAQFDFAPFSQVFPKCAVVIHHGGVGTCSQAFVAGVPQLVMPMAHDQPDNAWRLKQLGVGDYLPPHRFRAPAIVDCLKKLLQSEDVVASCQSVQHRMQEQMAPAQVGELLEGFAQRHLRG